MFHPFDEQHSVTLVDPLHDRNELLDKELSSSLNVEGFVDVPDVVRNRACVVDVWLGQELFEATVLFGYVL